MLMRFDSDLKIMQMRFDGDPSLMLMSIVPGTVSRGCGSGASALFAFAKHRRFFLLWSAEVRDPDVVDCPITINVDWCLPRDESV